MADGMAVIGNLYIKWLTKQAQAVANNRLTNAVRCRACNPFSPALLCTLEENHPFPHYNTVRGVSWEDFPKGIQSPTAHKELTQISQTRRISLIRMGLREGTAAFKLALSDYEGVNWQNTDWD